MTTLAALGAFLSGVGSVIGALWALRRVRQQAEAECEKRFAAFRQGMKLGRKRER
ncbi:MAG TPA: hypothetical protein VH834_18015 [Solirubrobacteraceae bacterium]|jgi:hypothetical protein